MTLLASSSASSLFGADFLVVSLVLGFLVWHLIKYWGNPGPTIWPVLGGLPGVIANFTHLYDWGTSLSKKYGTWRLVVPGAVTFFVADPHNVEHVLKTNFSNYPKGPDFLKCLNDLLGNGIFNSDDKLWLIQRKTSSHEFAAKSLRELMVRSSREISQQRLLPLLHESAIRNQEIDLQDFLARFNFDNICCIAFGSDPKCLSPGFPEVAFAKAFSSASEASFRRFFGPTWIFQLKKALSLGTEKDLMESLRVINTFSQEIIKSRKQELKEANSGGSSPVSANLLTRFMSLKTEDGSFYPDSFLRDTIINFILAGRDTSAVAMSWFFWILSKHPAVQEKIREELSGIIANRPTIQAPSLGTIGFTDQDTFTYDELKEMHYLHAALTESMRLYPPVPGDQKYALQNDVLPDGTFIPGGSRVQYDMYAMARLERVWGKDCLDFKPERWIANGQFLPASPFLYPIFNAGPRTCLGRDFAYLLMKTVVASVLLKFQFVVRPSFVPVYVKSLTLHMEGGLPVTINLRK